MPQEASPASLEAFEIAVARRDGEAAFGHALSILKSVDDRYGRLDAIGGPASGVDGTIERIATRFAAAFGALICDPAAPLTPERYEQLMAHHRWLELMFSVSGFGGPEHLVPLLATGQGQARRVPQGNLPRFLTIFSAAAGMDLNLDEAMRANPAATVGAVLGYLGSRFVLTDAAQAFRERLLAWLPTRLAEVNLGDLALQNLASPYMHCSYATSPLKHAVKAPMMAQMRRALIAAGAAEYDPANPPRSSPRPTIVVTTENFSFGHSVWRTHSLAVMALKERFHVVGYVLTPQISPETEECFDELVPYAVDGTFLEVVRALAADIAARQPAMVLHLGVGMSALVIALASLRLAPVQAASFGHTATTGSSAMDGYVLPDDFVGDPACFGEPLVRLPAAAMPYRMRAFDYAGLRERAAAGRGTRGDGAPTRIAVPASSMKLNPPFLDALAQAAAAARRPIEFHVLPLGGAGLGLAELRLRLAERLPMAVVHEEAPYDGYAERLATCDFFVCPFPYGNMNSIVDAALLGLPGVCLDGAEAHAHADAAYFERMGFPAELVAASLRDYVASIVRLADDRAWLEHCRAIAAAVGPGHPFFDGDAGLFVAAMAQLIDEAVDRSRP